MPLMPDTDQLPHALYRADQVRAMDRAAIEEQGIPGEELMRRAGEAGYRLARTRWPATRHLTVLCGGGNNGGDGYVVARLALLDGLAVEVLALVEPGSLKGAALAMAEAYLAAGGSVRPFGPLPRRTDLIVDALLGTGLDREVQGDWAKAIVAANEHLAPKLAIDIPSGLHADTGQVLGVAIRADATISFIGLKQGLFTGEGPTCCGAIRFSALALPAVVWSREILAARRIDWSKQADLLVPRRRSAHKGDFGTVLVVGGAPGMAGAARLAGEAALRAGAGLVAVATHPAHAAVLGADRPELMCHAIPEASGLDPLLERADVVALGPGLGQGDWGCSLYQRVMACGLPLVVDADALNLLAKGPRTSSRWVLTPHPGEAGRLLGCRTAEIQADRFAAVRRLQEVYGGVAVLKGAGTLIYGASHRPPAVCSGGNPGMASGGMGDALTGIIAALAAQGLHLEEAAAAGVSLHAAAGDRAALHGGERGLLASDLIAAIRPILNRQGP